MRAPIFKRRLSALDGVKLKPKARTFLVWDTLERGLALQVRPSGCRSYKFIYSSRADHGGSHRRRGHRVSVSRTSGSHPAPARGS